MIKKIKKELLHKIESNFSRNLLDDMGTTCSNYLINHEVDNPLFLFIIQSVCLDIERYLESIQPVKIDTHDEIENNIRPQLIAAINALDDIDLYNKVSIFNGLVNSYRKIISK